MTQLNNNVPAETQTPRNRILRLYVHATYAFGFTQPFRNRSDATHRVLPIKQPFDVYQRKIICRLRSRTCIQPQLYTHLPLIEYRYRELQKYLCVTIPIE